VTIVFAPASINGSAGPSIAVRRTGRATGGIAKASSTRGAAALRFSARHPHSALTAATITSAPITMSMSVMGDSVGMAGMFGLDMGQNGRKLWLKTNVSWLNRSKCKQSSFYLREVNVP
jgi:hypothetical protein